MYVSYFGLKQSPFRTAPDPDYFFGSGLHLRAVDRVVHAIRERAGLILVMGEIGQGKTTVCRYIQTRYRDEFVMGYLGNPFLDVREFGRQILLEFGLAGDVAGTGDIIRVLATFLKDQDRQGKVVVLFLDEAHLLSPDVLEFLLIVTNIQHRGRHLLQMVLAGQNEFQETLRQPRFASLNQRLGNRIMVTDLTKKEVAEYIRFRLDQAGWSGKTLFTSGAVSRIWKVTRGNPRLINQVCERLLEGAYEGRVHRIVPRDVEQVCTDPVCVPLLFPNRKHGEQYVWGPVLVGTFLALGLVGFSSPLHPPGPSGNLAVSALVPSREKPVNVTSGSLEMSEHKAPGTPGSVAAVDGDNGTQTGVEAKLEKILELLAQRKGADIARPGTTNPGRRSQTGASSSDSVLPARSSGQEKPARASRNHLSEIREPVLPSSPEIVVAAIVWDPLPRSRLAVVNERIVKQGDVVGRGYTVEAIRKDSIRLVKAGRMFENRVHGKGKK
ncbi:AAA family ATPase [Desulfoplanes formicivorans]|uniref:Peptidoglycan-binding protein n=1 Tax=Desulfoplanes formicivorans TaxID=1592317 RepID=A0A194AG13_9BACT|nr:AAA family ATPase [Desulfoplanes formicivorans]GAU08026.1 peptidoglycan-binding protein [Desulfoplanes formicivorans]